MLLFSDGFDAYAATADLTKKWASNSNTAATTLSSGNGRFGGNSVRLVSAAGTLSTQVFNAGLANYSGFAMCGCWFRASAKPSGNMGIIQIGSILNPSGLVVGIGPTGVIGASVNGMAGLAFSTVGVCDNQYHWIEAQLGFSISGSRPLLVTVDGTTVYSLTQSVVVNSGPLQSVSLVTTAGGITIDIDDLIVWDDQTGLQTGELVTANFPIGAKKCETQWPNGAGTNTNWAPLTGANYAQVNENPSDWDTSYVQASASGIRDSYAFPGSIVGVNPLVAVVNAVAKNADAGSISIQGLTYSGASYGLGDSKPAGSAYTTTQFPLFRDPNTGAAWTKAGVNAAQFGVGVV